MTTTERVNLDEITEGDAWDKPLTFTKDDGSAWDITDWTVYFTVKSSENDDDSEALIQKTITNHDAPLDGKTSISLTSSDTSGIAGTKVYDVTVVKGSGAPQTIIKGSVPFGWGVTDSA